MLRPRGMILLMMRLLQLVSRQLGFCRVTLIAGVTTPGLLVIYPWRPGPGDDALLRQLVSRLSPIPFLKGRLQGTGQLEEGGPPEESCEPKASS